MEYDFYEQPILNSPNEAPQEEHGGGPELPDYSAMDFKELLAACPLLTRSSLFGPASSQETSTSGYLIDANAISSGPDPLSFDGKARMG